MFENLYDDVILLSLKKNNIAVDRCQSSRVRRPKPQHEQSRLLVGSAVKQKHLLHF